MADRKLRTSVQLIVLINDLLSVVVTGGKKMTENPIKLLDVVALTVDLPDYNLWRGQVGTVVETLANNTAFEVEFSDRDGRTFESIELRPEQIMVVNKNLSDIAVVIN